MEFIGLPKANGELFNTRIHETLKAQQNHDFIVDLHLPSVQTDKKLHTHFYSSRYNGLRQISI